MMKPIVTLAFLVASASVPISMMHGAAQDMTRSRSVVATVNAQQRVLMTTYADCFNGPPEACGAAQEARDLAAGSTH